MVRPYLQAALAVMCVAAGTSGLVYTWHQTFTGDIRIQTETAEAVAIALPSEAQAPWKARVERMLGKHIPFAAPSNASGWIDENQYYDVAALPFAIAITKGKTITPHALQGTLSIKTPAGVQRVNAAPGTGFRIGAQRFTIENVRPWRGLVAAPGNPPMAALTVAVGGTELPTDSVVVPNGAWVRLADRTALHFAWVDSPGAAEQSLSDSTAKGDLARWGVAEGDTTEWLSSFQPGSGLAMEDGSSVTLIRRNDNHPGVDGPTSAIEVAIDRHGISEHRWIALNEVPQDCPVRFEDLTRLPLILHVAAWEPGKAQVRLSRNGEWIADAHLAKGETWSSPDSSLTVRLDEVLPSATAIGPDESTLYEVVAHSPDRQLRVPEHGAVTCDGATIRFEPAVTPSKVRFSIAVYEPGGKPPVTVTLDPDDELQIAGWDITQHPTRLTSDKSAVLQLRRAVPHWEPVAAFATIGMGMILLVTAFRRRCS